MEQSLRKNQIIPLTITAITQDGNGLGRGPDGMVVFVPMTAVGDRINARIVKALKSHAFGIVEELVEPSPQREENTCPVYRRCGGCGLRHMRYDAELAIKQDWVTENLARIGHIRVPMDEPLPAPREGRYRNKAQYPIRRVGGRLRVGFYAKRSHELIPAEDCLLQPECFRSIAAAFCAFAEEQGLEPYDEATGEGLLRVLYLRRGEATGQVMACIVINGGGIPGEEQLVERLLAACPEIATVALNINRRRDNVILGDTERVLYGSGRIDDILCGVKVSLSPRSFYQVNREAAELLYRKALAYAAPSKSDTLLDLYCGAGTIGLSMAEQAGRIIGVEAVEAAVRDANANARENGIANAEFVQADAAQAVDLLRERGIKPDIVILDPPRKGAAAEVLLAIRAMHPKKIVYISCNSATLARDLAKLEELDYKTVRAGAVDLFPRTAHVECVALLERIQNSEKNPITMEAALDEY